MSEPATGFVYVLHAVIEPSTYGWSRSSVGPYKIGFTFDFSRRFRELRAIAGITLTLVHTIEASDPQTIEKAIHQYFKAKRVSGEWFALDDADVRLLKQM